MDTFITSLNSKSYWQGKLSVGYLKHIPQLRLSKHLSAYEEYCGFSVFCHMFYSLALLHQVLMMYGTTQLTRSSCKKWTANILIANTLWPINYQAIYTAVTKPVERNPVSPVSVCSVLPVSTLCTQSDQRSMSASIHTCSASAIRHLVIIYSIPRQHIQNIALIFSPGWAVWYWGETTRYQPNNSTTPKT